MDNTLSFGVALIFLSAAIIYVIIQNMGRNREIENQERKNQERDIESVIYKIEMDELEKQLSRKEISKDKYERLRKNIEEQHAKKMVEIGKKDSV